MEMSYSVGIIMFNSLPQSIKNSSNSPKQFKSALKNYLNAHSFYSTDEYLNGKKGGVQSMVS
jgi:hypothetical protein